MRLDKLRVVNVRAWEVLELTFHERLTLLVGRNASGKSTILDAQGRSFGRTRDDRRALRSLERRHAARRPA